MPGDLQVDPHGNSTMLETTRKMRPSDQLARVVEQQLAKVEGTQLVVQFNGYCVTEASRSKI